METWTEKNSRELTDFHKLNEYVKDHATGKFEWGVNDCFTFALGWYWKNGLLQSVKQDYNDLSDVKRKLRNSTLYNMYTEGLKANHFETKSDWSFCENRSVAENLGLRTGDICVLKHRRKRFNATLGLVQRNPNGGLVYSVFLSHEGLTMLMVNEDMEFYRGSEALCQQ